VARNITTWVGGREVIAQGDLILSGGDLTAGVYIANLTFNFTVLHSYTELPTAVRQVTDSTNTNITIRGLVDASGSVWWYENVATFGASIVSLAFMIQAFSGNPANPHSYRIAYTFSESAPTPALSALPWMTAK
jgi:hypothetical protein